MGNKNQSSDSKIIQSIIKRLEQLEKVILGISPKSLQKRQRNDFSGATGGIRLLISKNFFNKKQSFGEIRKELSKYKYYYSRQAINQALQNLSGNKGPLVKLKEKGNNFYVKRK